MTAAYGLLALAIGVEIGATATLPRSRGFTEPGWTAVVLGGYAVSIWLLAIVVRSIPVSITYALWSGIGTAAIAVIGAVFLHERLDLVKAGAVVLIVAGVVLLNLHSASH